MARRRGIVRGETGVAKRDGTGFVGADGRLYPDLRRAFGRYSGIKQCPRCKSGAQGAWFCRIAHGHLDRPDHDGGDSARALAVLEDRGAEYLEGELARLLEDQARGCPEDSLEVLSEDLLCHVAGFLPDLAQLSALCQTSQQGRLLLHQSVYSEALLRGVYLRAFGEPGAACSTRFLAGIV